MLGGDGGGRPTPETAVVDARDGRVVVGALLLDLCVGDGGGGSKHFFFFDTWWLGCGFTGEVVVVVGMGVGEVIYRFFL